MGEPSILRQEICDGGADIIVSSLPLRERENEIMEITDSNDDGDIQVSRYDHPSVISLIQSPVAKPRATLDRFEAYIEDTLGTYAPQFKHGDILATEFGQGHRDGNGVTVQAHYTPIRHLEVEMSTRPTLDLEDEVSSLDAADLELLKAKGAFDFPSRHLQEELINAHFTEVHPTAPVINKTEFLSDFHNHRMPSRLLLFAVFTSGSRACRNPALLDHKGTNHMSAQRFYKAAKVGRLLQGWKLLRYSTCSMKLDR